MSSRGRTGAAGQCARESLALQDDNLEIARLARAGRAGLDARSGAGARAARADRRDDPAIWKRSYNSAISRLGVLTGQAPGALKAELEAAKPIPRGPASVAAGIPAETLRQRPDVRAAERNLAAATAQIGVAEAQLYPALGDQRQHRHQSHALGWRSST